MHIPGTKRSTFPDQCGFRAGRFVEAVRIDDMATAWNMLSRECQGVRQGIWGTQKAIDLQIVYQAAHDPQHPMFSPMMKDFRETVLSMWPLEDLTNLWVSPTSYVDDQHAFAFLPFGVTEDSQVAFHQGGVKSGIIIPMFLEDGDWKIDLPGWRFAWT